MTLLMVTLANNFRDFEEFGGSNAEFELDEKPRDNEDPKNELRKRV
jgi:hypothetical protein